MSGLIIPKNYTPFIDYMESQRAIKKIKDFFQQELAYGLRLSRVSAPLFVAPESGLNDNLNGVERTVSFTIKDMDEKKGRDRAVSCKMEENGARKIQVQAGYRALHGHERDKAR